MNFCRNFHIFVAFSCIILVHFVLNFRGYAKKQQPVFKPRYFLVYKPVYKPVFKPGTFRSKKTKKNRVFSVERNFFPLAAGFFLASILFITLGAFFVVTSLLFLILCNTKKLLLCVSSEKKGLEVLKSTFVAFGHFLCWTGFIFGSGFFLV